MGQGRKRQDQKMKNKRNQKAKKARIKKRIEAGKAK